MSDQAFEDAVSLKVPNDEFLETFQRIRGRPLRHIIVRKSKIRKILSRAEDENCMKNPKN